MLVKYLSNVYDIKYSNWQIVIYPSSIFQAFLFWDSHYFHDTNSLIAKLMIAIISFLIIIIS